MSNPDITALLAGISEAKRALDAEPGHLARIRELEQRIAVDGNTIAAREKRIHELKASHDEVTAKLRSVEAERDDAGFRALEEADKVSALSTLLRGFIGDANRALAAAEGRRPDLIIAAEVAEATEIELTVLRQQRSNLEVDKANLQAQLEEVQALLTSALHPLPSGAPALSSVPHEPEASSTGGTNSSQGSGDGGPFVSSTEPPSPSAKDYSTSVAGEDVERSAGVSAAIEEAGGAEDPFAPRAPSEPAPASSSGAGSIESAASQDLRHSESIEHGYFR
jgi:hypothetical protein